VRRPPVPFDPATATLPAGHLLYRVLSATRTATDFNPGVGSPTRFGFFGKPTVPIMYAADTEDAAIAETLLHDIPAEGGLLPYDQYASKVLVRLEVAKSLRHGGSARNRAATPQGHRRRTHLKSRVQLRRHHALGRSGP
jgi:hypothetical protein